MTDGTTSTTETTGTWRAGVLLFDGFEPLDAIGPAEVLWALPRASEVAGVAGLPATEVHLVSESGGPVTAGYGLVVQSTDSYAGCPPLDLLVVPGGGADAPQSSTWGVQYFRHHEPTLAFVRRQAEHADVVASVCTGTFILAGSGVLAGHRATTHWRSRQALVEAMAERAEPFELVEARVVDDGDLVTAGGVTSGIELALHLVGRIFGDEYRKAAALDIERETPVSA